MTNKTATASIIAAVGVVAVVGAIAVVATHTKKALDERPASANIRLSTLCSSTLYPARCERSLSPVVNESSNPEDVLRASLQVALDEVGAAFARYADVGKGARDSVTRSALRECKKLLHDAVEDLRGMAGLSPMQAIGHVTDLRTWLSGVMTYIYTCADGFEKLELKQDMDKVLQNSTELSSNALAIITLIGDFMSGGEEGKLNKSPGGSRRLLGWQTVDASRRLLGGQKLGTPTTDVIGTIDDLGQRRHKVPPGSFPEWVPRRDRRLLQLGAQAPNTVVAADGSGDFKTIAEALGTVPRKSEARYVIYVKAGEYRESVTVSKDMANVFMYGDGPTRTVVVGNKSNRDGFATIATRTFSAEGNGFICRSMGFANTAGPEGHQAVALHIQGDMSVFFNCRFEGYQDTLYVHTNRQFFRNCEVLGTIDFVFGNSAALLQNCLLTVRRPMDNQANMVTAQGRTDPNMPTGIVLQGCRIVPEQALFPVRLQVASYLGRPWKEYARTVVMETTIGDLIKPEGWSEWMGDLGLSTLYYAEYANTGPGAGTSKRVSWPGYRVIGQAEATHYTAGVFIDGMTWLLKTGTPNVMGFIK